MYTDVQQTIAAHLTEDSTVSMWQDWRWQLRHCINDRETFEKVLGISFDAEDRHAIDQTMERFPLSVTPYYASLIDRDNYRNDPVFKQAFPVSAELDVGSFDMRDPLHEDADSPAPGITHRYPDRVLFHVSNTCSMYCRHCTRKRKVGDTESIPDREALQAGIAYIRDTPVVRDVLLSGGDPLMMSDEQLEWLLQELRAIPHVEIIRLGTRMPVVLPYRITDELCAMLGRYHPLWVNTHFNHPREFTTASRRALAKLADAGCPLGNQSVLLAGVNDCPRIMRSLVHKLVASRVRPYYLYQCDLSEGLEHFRTPVGKGIEIIESLIGHTTGFAVPTYVIDAPGGGGKIPVMPNYLISWSTHKVVLRNYEGVICTYHEPDSFPRRECDRNCGECVMDIPTADSSESDPVGIARLMSDHDDFYTLVPEDNVRLQRRDDA